MKHKINRNYNIVLGNLNLDCNKPIYLCDKSEIATCLICNRNYHEGAVNMIDYEVDVCIHCEPKYKQRLDGPEFDYALKEEVTCDVNPDWGLPNDTKFVVASRIVEEEGNHLYILRLENDNGQRYEAWAMMLQKS
ncbi:MAG: hypothetical protein ACQEXV_22200 [Bacillota bacterium]